MKQHTLPAGLLLISTSLGSAALIGFNAEDGSSITTTTTASLGADFDPPVSDSRALGGSYITISSPQGSAGNVPGSVARTATYNVLFSEAGSYDLYAKVLVEASNADDSMFYAREFGTPDPANDGTPIGWATINSLDAAATPGGDFTWVNLSQFSGGEGGSSFENVTAGTQEFWIGGREDGLFIDAFAFGTTGETFSDAELDASVIPEPGTTALLFGALGLLARRRRS